MTKNDNGAGLVSVLVFLGVSMTVMLSLLTLINNLTRAQSRVQTKMDSLLLRDELAALFWDSAVCTEVFQGQELDVTAESVAEKLRQRASDIKNRNLGHTTLGKYQLGVAKLNDLPIQVVGPAGTDYLARAYVEIDSPYNFNPPAVLLKVTVSSGKITSCSSNTRDLTVVADNQSGDGWDSGTDQSSLDSRAACHYETSNFIIDAKVEKHQPPGGGYGSSFYVGKLYGKWKTPDPGLPTGFSVECSSGNASSPWETESSGVITWDCWISESGTSEPTSTKYQVCSWVDKTGSDEVLRAQIVNSIGGSCRDNISSKVITCSEPLAVP
ncbi:MAG: hypothetical protein KDD59_05825 [Bdellovibrionales bacterium]|nr:hypothetical protein [Bdellovibrionales bacterium]